MQKTLGWWLTRPRVGLAICAFSLAAPLPLQTAEYHVAPNGTAAASGTRLDPLSLSKALSASSPAHAGDTIWLHDGTYTGTFVSSLTGSSNRPVIVRQYPGARATLDCTATNSAALTINGDWAWYWGFEVMNSSTNRVNTRGAGVDIYGANTKCINLLIHDAGVGIGAWSTATNAEIYGCLVYNNGWQGAAPDRGHGHAIYAQNFQGTKLIRDNILFNQFGWGVHIYTQRGVIQGFDLIGNTAFNNGTVSRDTNHHANYLVGGFTPADRITLRQNIGYHTPSSSGPNLQLGYHATNNSVVVQSNYFAGGSVSIQSWTNTVFTDNTVATFGVPLLLRSAPGVGHWLLDRNHYLAAPAQPFDLNGKRFNLTNWPSASGYDRNSQFTANKPVGIQVFLRPNLYETNRVTIILFNWDGSERVPVNLTGLLPEGSPYEIRNAQDFYGSPVLSGRYSGAPILVPMTGLNLKSPAPIGLKASTRQPSWPEFNVFVLLTGNK